MERNAAILIDCWHESPAFVPSLVFYNWIKLFVQCNKSIDTVILATYDCKYQEYKSDNQWYNNSKELLSVDRYNEKTNKLFNYKNHQTTDARFLNWNSGKTQIAMHHEWELEKYLEQNKLDNIYMCGRAWESCVADRPLGYKSIRKSFPDIGIRVNLGCVANKKWNSVFFKNINLDPEWTRIGTGTYQWTSQ